jgi:hypothetical protein
MKLYVCIFDDARLLPHFLKHYASFGISAFHIALPPHLAGYVTEKSAGYDVRQHVGLDVADSFIGGVSAVTNMRLATQGPEEWAVIVDLDEFVEFGEPVKDIAKRLDAARLNAQRGIMYDRLAQSGQPTPFDEFSDLPSLYPVRVRVTKEVMGGLDRKAVMVKGHLKSRGAHHSFHDERGNKSMLEISHYKWNEKALDRIRAAHEALLANGVGWADQYKMVLDHYDAHGRIAWETIGGELTGAR